MPVIVQHHGNPVRPGEGLGGLLEIALGIPSRRRPGVPHLPGERLALLAQRALSAWRSHEPLVPEATGLRQGKNLLRIVAGVPHREHHQVRGAALAQSAGTGHRASPPVMADQQGTLQCQAVDECQHIASQSRQLPAARSRRIAEAGRGESPEGWCQHPIAGVRQGLRQVFPGMRAVRPTVQQDGAARPLRIPLQVGDIQDIGGNEGIAAHRTSPRESEGTS